MVFFFFFIVLKVYTPKTVVKSWIKGERGETDGHGYHSLWSRTLSFITPVKKKGVLESNVTSSEL